MPSLLAKPSVFAIAVPRAGQVIDSGATEVQIQFDNSVELNDSPYATITVTAVLHGSTSYETVEEKFGEQNFQVFSEMRILGKIGVAILDFGRVC